MCRLETPPCVHKRHRVCPQHAHMLTSMCACSRHTRRCFECTHGGVLSLHTEFSACHTTRHTHHTHHTHHTNTTTHNDTHTTPHGDRDREKRQRLKQMLVYLIPVLHSHCHARCACREEKMKEKMKNKMKEKKTEIMMWTNAESKLAQEKAKLAS